MFGYCGVWAAGGYGVLTFRVEALTELGYTEFCTYKAVLEKCDVPVEIWI
jgi:hypothetical protein